MEIDTNLKKIDYIYHLADIHFPKNIVSDDNIHLRYETMMNNIYKHIESINYKACVTVITGDLLNNNDQGSPDLIKTCIQFINKLGEYMPVIIIAGNHDYNHTTQKTWFDVLDAATNDNVHFLSESGFYILKAKINKLLIGFQAITDKYYSFFYENQNISSVKHLYNCKRAIALFHGNVAGCKMKSKTWNYDESEYNENSSNPDYNINKHWMKEYDLVLLGHIHERQKIEPNIYYAGSTIQRTFAESYNNHGGLLFNVVTLKYRKIDYQDLYANIVLNEIDAKLHVDLPSKDHKYFLRIHHTDSLSVIDRKEIEEYYKNNYDIVNITWQYSANVSSKEVTSKIINPAYELNINNIFDDVIKDFTPDVKDKLRDLNSNKNTHINNTSGSSISLQTLRWKNVFCYGDTINKLDFNNDLEDLKESIVTVISAPNTSGKSTIWRIILVALYADIDQRTIVTKLTENIVNKYATKGFIELSCKINNNDCIIKRQFKMNNSRCTHNYVITVNGVEHDKTWLKNNLIPYDVLISNFSLTKDSESIYSKTLGKLQKYINDTFNLDTISDTITETTTKITKLSNDLIAETARKETIQSKLSEIENIDVDEINDQIIDYKQQIKSLKKPINKFNIFSNIYVSHGNIVPVNITSQEYIDIISFYKNKKLNKNIISIYNNDSQNYINLIDQIELSNKVKKYINTNNIDELAKLLNIHNDTLANKCWEIIQNYADIINNVDNVNNVNMNDCSDYLFKTQIVIPVKYNINYNNETPTIFTEMIVYDNIPECDIDVNFNIDIDNVYNVYNLFLELKKINCTLQSELYDNDIVNITTNQISSITKKLKSRIMNFLNTGNNRKIRDDLEEVQKLIQNNPPIDFTTLSKDVLIHNLKSCVNILSNIRDNDEYVTILRQKNAVFSYDYFNNVYTYCVVYLNKYNEYALQQNGILYNYHVNNLSKYYRYLQQKTEQNNSILESAQKFICSDEMYYQYNDLIESIYKWCEDICYTVTSEYNRYDIEYDKYNDKRIELNNKISKLENQKELYESSYTKYTKLIEDLTCKCTGIENDIDINKKYKLSLENTRIQIIKNGLKNLEMHINNELESYIQYHIQIVFKEAVNKSTQFSINIKHSQSGHIIFYENLSGYEKAIVQFVTMHIINSFSENKFNLFYIDEAFDVFDENNFNKYISHLLQIATVYSQNVLFVTHRTLPMFNTSYVLKTIEQINGTSIIN